MSIVYTNNLDMHSGGVPLIIHLGQYDSDFSLVFNLYSSVGALTIESGTTAEIRGTKSDGFGYSADATIDIVNKKVTVAGSNQMTAAARQNIFELVLLKNNKVLSSANFILDVEHAALDADTIQDESVMKELNAIIEGAATATQAAQDADAAADRAEAAADDLSGTVQQVATNTQDIAELKDDLDNIEPISEDIKIALLNCFQHVAWIDEHGQDYYDALEDALYPETGLVSISAVFTQGSAVIYPSTPLNDLKAYLVVTGFYNDGTSRTITDYSLSGTLEVGTSTITVTKDEKTTTFNVTVSQPYWDYEWNASSGVLPQGMTATEYDFTTEPGALFAKTPQLDFDYIGNCRLQIEMLGFYVGNTGVISYVNSNPQIQIVANDDGTNKKGVKFICNYDGAGQAGRGGIGVNGVNSALDVDTSQYHLIDLTNNNGVYTLAVDGISMPVTQNTNITQYLSYTGIATATHATGAYYGAYIKSIKFKRL